MNLERIITPILCLGVLCGGASENKPVFSTVKDQVSVNVTVYNNNLGLIRDAREVTLKKGGGELRFEDVASHINPASVHVKSLNLGGDFVVREQNYEYDLMNERKLLDKYVGKKVKLIDVNKYQNKKNVIDAELLSNNNGQVFRIKDEIYLGHPGLKVLPEIPENLIARPTLTWLYKNKAKKAHRLEVSYLTEQITWKADYIFLLGEKEDSKTDLSGWVTLDNKSGATYKNAGLKLVAGDVNRIRDTEYRKASRGKMMAMADSEAGFSEKEFFEYHLYTLPGKTTIKDNQSKQIRLLEAAGIEAQKELVVSSSSRAYTYRGSDQKRKEPVFVYMKFLNAKQNNLGQPLPKGIVRVYKKDTDGSQVFLGEDRIGHTPKDEEVKLKIGKAFDIVAERLQTDYVRVSSKAHETAWQITLRNHKAKPVKVSVKERLQGSWKISKKSHDYVKEDAFTIRFNVSVPADKEVKVSYRVKVKLDGAK